MFKKILYYGNENNKITALSVAILFLSVLFQIAPFIFVYMAINKVVCNEPITAQFLIICSVGILITLFLQVLTYCKGLSLSHIAAYGTLMNLRISLQKKMEILPLGVIESKGTGTFKKIFVDDIDSLELLLAHAIPEGISNIMGIVVAYLFILVTDWKLGLLVLITIPIGMIPVILMYKIGNNGMNAYYSAGQGMNNTIIEYVNGMEVVKVFNKAGESYEKLKKAVNNYRDYTLAWFKACWPWMAAYNAMIPCTILFALPVGAYFVWNGLIGLSRFVLALCLALGLGSPLLRTMSFMSTIPQIKYKIDELEKLMDYPSLKNGDQPFHGTDYGIIFEDVCFGYDKSDVIHHVNLKIAPNTKTAFVGESGSGKSTLAKLLVHYYDIHAGSILIGGQNICDMSLEQLNKLVAYVSQDNFLFNTNLMENIRVGKPEASDSEVIEAARKAQCLEFIEKLPAGFFTMAGDCGNQLSGGEKQRITLARAILKNAPIIVLDEATAFADAENESKIEAILSEFVHDKTLIVIAHRLSTIINADQICVLANGEITGSGRHEELLKENETYRALWIAHQKSIGWQIIQREG